MANNSLILNFEFLILNCLIKTDQLPKNQSDVIIQNLHNFASRRRR